ncbi:RNA polymerase sigma factor [Pedobacter caeni]|uniref:Sigma-70, region 4 n=1 Tax=Pedobacter caeni TaxID=288992 RepID=A0A1M5AE56_9SPHI|nr:sigma factor-like helix-turn-helix DNA-binding protein [Pedobacter caeni]SHF28192.1 Sigma-70, region 4 [Pedobacter caeni]
MLETTPQSLTEHKPQSIRSLYERHGGMLLGYIFEVVKDRKLAEEYLIKIFCDLSVQLNDVSHTDISGWPQLQKFTREKLLSSAEHSKFVGLNPGLKMSGAPNHYLEQLTEEQRQVFCDVYYYGKTIADISKTLNLTEDLTRKALKEAFAIMRKGSEN